MRKVKGKNTSPELQVRKLVYSLGFRYRLHRKELPGKPDLVFISKKKVIFINGCFWHGHSCQRGSRKPKTNQQYWTEKINKNILRDRKNIEELSNRGWESLVIWGCELRGWQKITSRY